MNAAASTSSSSGGASKTLPATASSARPPSDCCAIPTTRRPTHSSSPAPAASTTPAMSMPRVNGGSGVTAATPPRQRATSPKLSEPAATRTSASPGPGDRRIGLGDLDHVRRLTEPTDPHCPHRARTVLERRICSARRVARVTVDAAWSWIWRTCTATSSRRLRTASGSWTWTVGRSVCQPGDRPDPRDRRERPVVTDRLRHSRRDRPRAVRPAPRRRAGRTDERP